MENPRFLEIVKANFSMDCNLIVGCQTGMERSIQAAEQLRRAGFSNVLRMRGGFDAEKDKAHRVVFTGWRRRGLPTTSKSPAADRYKSLAARADTKAGMPTKRRRK